LPTELEREEIRKLIWEVLKEELGYDKVQYLNILDRLARLEEGQKAILSMMDKRFEDNNKRFEDINKRFEDINKRFEDLYTYVSHRFEDMNKRFTMLTTFMAIGYSGLAILITLLKIFP
jgi:chromosome segregation ATPase